MSESDTSTKPAGGRPRKRQKVSHRQTSTPSPQEQPQHILQTSQQGEEQLVHQRATLQYAQISPRTETNQQECPDGTFPDPSTDTPSSKKSSDLVVRVVEFADVQWCYTHAIQLDRIARFVQSRDGSSILQQFKKFLATGMKVSALSEMSQTSAVDALCVSWTYSRETNGITSQLIRSLTTKPRYREIQSKIPSSIQDQLYLRYGPLGREILSLMVLVHMLGEMCASNLQLGICDLKSLNPMEHHLQILSLRGAVRPVQTLWIYHNGSFNNGRAPAFSGFSSSLYAPAKQSSKSLPQTMHPSAIDSLEDNAMRRTLREYLRGSAVPDQLSQKEEQPRQQSELAKVDPFLTPSAAIAASSVAANDSCRHTTREIYPQSTLETLRPLVKQHLEESRQDPHSSDTSSIEAQMDGPVRFKPPNRPGYGSDSSRPRSSSESKIVTIKRDHEGAKTKPSGKPGAPGGLSKQKHNQLPFGAALLKEYGSWPGSQIECPGPTRLAAKYGIFNRDGKIEHTIVSHRVKSAIRRFGEDVWKNFKNLRDNHSKWFKGNPGRAIELALENDPIRIQQFKTVLEEEEARIRSLHEARTHMNQPFALDHVDTGLKQTASNGKSVSNTALDDSEVDLNSFGQIPGYKTGSHPLSLSRTLALATQPMAALKPAQVPSMAQPRCNYTSQFKDCFATANDCPLNHQSPCPQNMQSYSKLFSQGHQMFRQGPEKNTLSTHSENAVSHMSESLSSFPRMQMFADCSESGQRFAEDAASLNTCNFSFDDYIQLPSHYGL